MPISQVLEGTWEEVAQHSERLAGNRVRRIGVDNGDDMLGANELPLHATASAETLALAILDWGHSHAPRSAPPLSDEAISRESIYFACN